jgi:cbb3-type cytochrome oxidase cytochrome c subunit
MDHWKRCRVGLAHWHFWFAQHVVESDSVVNEGVSPCHHMFQTENYKISCVGSFDFHNKKDNG